MVVLAQVHYLGYSISLRWKDNLCACRKEFTFGKIFERTEIDFACKNKIILKVKLLLIKKKQIKCFH